MSQGRGLTVRQQDAAAVFERALHHLIRRAYGDGNWQELR